MSSNFPYYFTQSSNVVELVNKTTTAGSGGVRISNNTTGTANSGKILEINGNIIQVGTGTTATGGNSVAIGTNASTSTYTNSVAIGAGATVRANNQISIGTISETVYTGKQVLAEESGTAGDANLGSLTITHNNTGGASSIVFKSKKNEGSDYGYIRYQDDYSFNTGQERARLTIGTENDSDDNIFIIPSGGLRICSTQSIGEIFRIYSSKFTGNDGDTGQPIYFYVNSVLAYGSSSDYRMKTDIFETEMSTDVKFIQSLKPKCFTFKNLDTKKYGFIAQELIETISGMESKYRDHYKTIVNNYDSYINEPDPETKPILGVGLQELVPSLVNVCKHTLGEIDGLKKDIQKIKQHLGIE